MRIKEPLQTHDQSLMSGIHRIRRELTAKTCPLMSTCTLRHAHIRQKHLGGKKEVQLWEPYTNLEGILPQGGNSNVCEAEDPADGAQELGTIACFYKQPQSSPLLFALDRDWRLETHLLRSLLREESTIFRTFLNIPGEQEQKPRTDECRVTHLPR